MDLCFFVSDLHGKIERYQKLFQAIRAEKPAAVFFGGDLLPHGAVDLFNEGQLIQDFIQEFLVVEFSRLKDALGKAYPRVFIILGNDDGRSPETEIKQGETEGLWEYAHNQKIEFGEFSVYGYAYVPPTPFTLKDWERYDVSRYVDPGCISPEEGWRTSKMDESEVRYATIQGDLDKLVDKDDLSKAIFLFHSPPYQTCLDRAALDEKIIEHVHVDVHVGSIAVKRFIETRQPLLSLHGHIHESASITGAWREAIGDTQAISAAHNGPELALVRFDPRNLENTWRELL